MVTVLTFDTRKASADALAGDFASFVAQYPFERCGLAVPGGRSPGPFLSAVKGLPLDWRNITATVGDERCVEPGAPDSNMRLLRAALGDTPVHFIDWIATAADLGPDAADRAGRHLAAFPFERAFALVGTAPDGHFASLFPATPSAARHAHALVVETEAPSEPRRRLSLTVPSFARMGQVALLVYGRDKVPKFEAALDGRTDTPLKDLIAAVPRLLVHIVAD